MTETHARPRAKKRGPVESKDNLEGKDLLPGDEDRLAETVMNTAEDDVFVQIPWVFGWSDPGEQRLRTKAMEEISEEISGETPPPKGARPDRQAGKA